MKCICYLQKKEIIIFYNELKGVDGCTSKSTAIIEQEKITKYPLE